MTERTYPRHQWVVHPRTGIPYKAKLVRKSTGWSSFDNGDVDSRGFSFSPKKMLRSKKEAIAKARQDIKRREKHLTQALGALNIQKIAVDEVEAKND